MIWAKNLTLAYGKKVILSDAEFHIEQGQAAVLVGENGSGKSTLLSAMAGALKPKSGTLLLRGKVGYIPQGSGLMEELTFGDNLRFLTNLAVFLCINCYWRFREIYGKIRKRNAKEGNCGKVLDFLRRRL